MRFVFSILLTLGAGLFIPFFLMLFPKIMGPGENTSARKDGYVTIFTFLDLNFCKIADVGYNNF